MPPGRNDPCPCGSGKKYKHCCIDVPAPPRQPTPAEWVNQGINHQTSGNFKAAKEAYQNALSAQPNQVDALHLLGTLLLQEGDADQAITLISQAIERHPRSAVMHNSLGAALVAAKRVDEGIAQYRQALAINLQYPEACNNLGLAMMEKGDHAQALIWFRKAALFRPDYFDAHCNAGIACFQSRQYEAARKSLLAAVQLAPNRGETYEWLGNTEFTLGNYDAALNWFDKGITITPRSASLHFYRGITLENKNRYDEAAESMRQAILLKPDSHLAYTKLGGYLLELEQDQEAFDAYQKAIELNESATVAWMGLGMVLSRHDYQAAHDAFKVAHKLAPDNPNTNWGLGRMKLKLGELEEGWKLYAAAMPERSGAPRDTQLPLWDGSDLTGKTLYVSSEQGIGDQILLASQLPEVASMAKHVILDCQDKLTSLFRRSFPNIEVYSIAEPPHPRLLEPDIDWWCPAGNLLQYLRTDISRFAHEGPYLVPPADKAAEFRERLAALGPEPKIGFSWRSRLMTTSRIDHYFRLEQLGPVLSVPGVKFVNLQYTDCRAELAFLRERFGVEVHHFEGIDLMNDLDSAAALTQGMDLVISVGTSVAQMSGALGIPTWWLLLPDIWDMLGTDRYPWYQESRAFLAEGYGKWDQCLAQVGDALRQWLEDRHG